MKHFKYRKQGLYLLLSIALLLVITTLKPVFSHNLGASLRQPLAQTSTDTIPTDGNKTHLKTLAQQQGITIGAAVGMQPFQEDAAYREILAREFNSLTPENAMKFARLHPDRDRYDFTQGASLIAFAQEHQMRVHGHVLVWHRTLPSWVREQTWSREDLSQVLREHIYTVVGRFRGQVDDWDVVNEAIGGKGNLRKSIWRDTLGPDYIEQAFRWAHAADPNARLFYNDYGGEGMSNKANAIYALVQDLVQRGVPIAGVGLQMHVSLEGSPDPEEVAANIHRLNELGLSVRITEMDVKVDGSDRPRPEQLEAQATIYRDMMAVCLAAADCTGLTTWGVTDQYSWIYDNADPPDAPLLFDEDYQPKPAYHAIAAALAN